MSDAAYDIYRVKGVATLVPIRYFPERYWGVAKW